MRSDGQCRSCRAPVRWVVTEANGKRMPLDPEPVPDGNVWVVRIEDGMPVVAVALSAEGVPPAEAFRYQSHFVSCADRDSWRKRT